MTAEPQPPSTTTNTATTTPHLLAKTKQSSSLFENSPREIPLVHVELQDVTYQPVTAGIPTSGRRRRPSKSKTTTVLDNISTTLTPFQLTAWMGPSGSGKTSLTSVVAGLVDPNDVTGRLLVNQQPCAIPKPMLGVVWQDDLILNHLTVEETILFSAQLATPRNVVEEDPQQLVDDIIQTLQLSSVRHTLMGGISGGERKRTAVAAELVTRPSVLLLDEPTSGLDATTAFQLMQTLQDLAHHGGHSIAVIIHQPRTDIFRLLDHLLLLSQGRVVYNGPPARVRSYLEGIPTVTALPPETGIADWIMDTIIADQAKDEPAMLARHWQEHVTDNDEDKDESTRQNSQPVPLHRVSSLVDLQSISKQQQSSQASFSKQFQLLLRRTLKQRRGEKFTRVSILLTLSYIAFTSLFWWRMPHTTQWIFERTSLLFFILIAQGNAIVTSSVAVFHQRDRALLRRERAKKLYGVGPYFLAKTVSDMTNNIILPMIYGIVTYWTAGLRPSASHFGKFLVSMYLTLNCAQSMGFFLSVWISNLQMALILAPPITLFFFIIGGFYIPINNMHVGIQWASYISFARYGYSSLLVNEFEHRNIPCTDEDDEDTMDCPLPGNAVYEGVGIQGVFANFWFNVAMVALLNVFFLMAAYGLLRRSK